MAKQSKTDQLVTAVTDEPVATQTTKVQASLKWIDENILPLVAILALLSLAVKGAITYLPQMNYTAQVIVSIVAVALLGVKAFANRK